MQINNNFSRTNFQIPTKKSEPAFSGAFLVKPDSSGKVSQEVITTLKKMPHNFWDGPNLPEFLHFSCKPEHDMIFIEQLKKMGQQFIYDSSDKYIDIVNKAGESLATLRDKAFHQGHSFEPNVSECAAKIDL